MRETLLAGKLTGYEAEVGAALLRLEDARRRTLCLFKDMPDGYVDLQTDGNRIGTVLFHMALIEADWLYTDILGEPHPDELTSLFPADDRDKAGVLTFVRGQTLAQHLERLSWVRQTLLDKLSGMTTEDFHRPRSIESYGVSPAWVLHNLTQHEAEHRSELGRAIAQLRGGD